MRKKMSFGSIGRTGEINLGSLETEKGAATQPSTGMNDEEFIKFMGGNQMPCMV